MTLIKFNIENKTKDQRKKEVLNKLRKIQSMVESDANYTEMVYHIISNASLQKKNMKVNLDHYGNYTVIDANNKIVGGGMFNSNGGNASVRPSTNDTSTFKTMNPRKNTNSKNPILSIQNHKPPGATTISQDTPGAVTDQATSQPIIKNGPEVSKDANTKVATNTSVTKKEKPGFFNSINRSLTSTLDIGTEGAAQNASETVGTDIGTEGAAEKVSGQTDTGTPDAEKSTESNETGTPDAEKSTESKKTGLFGFNKFWGGKNNSKSMDNDSYPSFQTTVFNDGSEEIFMEHMKNMSSKKYLRSLTTQELKDIMRSNHMKVTHNGSYYNKEQMVNKVYQFYK